MKNKFLSDNFNKKVVNFTERDNFLNDNLLKKLCFQEIERQVFTKIT